ncbi:glutaredoxin family protein [Falsibacillus albus]|uniref:NrdH-redoxin n=1 Tax=Falsibacillus albus TaxID=2478915 RepID=A0A3L7JIJ2_9BACI|nr:glutaredoxin domain-containing protein [Falsibacillus albus]RLQ90607.1 NrdH-redoxin [Falsibacillus albus]
MKANVIVYSQPACPPCEFTKMFLKDNHIEFVEKNIKSDPSARKELMQTYNAFSTPVIVINGEAIIGFDQEKITSLLKIK